MSDAILQLVRIGPTLTEEMLVRIEPSYKYNKERIPLTVYTTHGIFGVLKTSLELYSEMK